MAGVQSSSFAYISEFHTKKMAPRAVAYSSMYNFGFLLISPLLLMLIIPMDWTWQVLGLDFRPWRLYVICNSLINLLNGIAFACLPESPKLLLSMDQKEKALNVLRRVYAFNTGKPPEVIWLLIYFHPFKSKWLFF